MSTKAASARSVPCEHVDIADRLGVGCEPTDKTGLSPSAGDMAMNPAASVSPVGVDTDAPPTREAAVGEIPKFPPTHDPATPYCLSRIAGDRGWTPKARAMSLLSEVQALASVLAGWGHGEVGKRSGDPGAVGSVRWHPSAVKAGLVSCCHTCPSGVDVRSSSVSISRGTAIASSAFPIEKAAAASGDRGDACDGARRAQVGPVVAGETARSEANSGVVVVVVVVVAVVVVVVGERLATAAGSAFFRTNFSSTVMAAFALPRCCTPFLTHFDKFSTYFSASSI